MLVTILEILGRTSRLRRKRVRAAAHWVHQERQAAYRRLLDQAGAQAGSDRSATLQRLLEEAGVDETDAQTRRLRLRQLHQRPRWLR